MFLWNCVYIKSRVLPTIRYTEQSLRIIRFLALYTDVEENPNISNK